MKRNMAREAIATPLLMLALSFGPRGLQARESWIVQDPAQLNLVSLEKGFGHIKARIRETSHLLYGPRRLAFKHQSRKWGIPTADKHPLALGCVARTDASGRVHHVLVLKGEIDGEKIRDRLVHVHSKSRRRSGTPPSVDPITQGDQTVTRILHSDRPIQFLYTTLQDVALLGTVPVNDDSLFQETLQAVRADPSLAAGQPAPVEISFGTEMTEYEREKVARFPTEGSQESLGKLRDRFRKLHEFMRPGGAEEEDLLSLDERLNQQFLASNAYGLTMRLTPGADNDSDLYRFEYVLEFDTPEAATRMRELMLEKDLFFRENSRSGAIPVTLDSATIDAQDNLVTVTVEVDTVEKQYDIAFSYLAMMLSHRSADRHLGVEGD